VVPSASPRWPGHHKCRGLCVLQQCTKQLHAVRVDRSLKETRTRCFRDLVGYADFDIPLATSRAVAVKKFLQRLVPIKVKIKIVTNLPARKVDVINTAT